VVIKRSGRRVPAWDASDFTAADHLICTILRQARNFFRPPLEYLHAKGMGSLESCREINPSSRSRWVWPSHLVAKIQRPGHSLSKTAGKLFGFAGEFNDKYFVRSAPRPVSRRNVRVRLFPR